jgi:FAD/FMN-containing dehydrogenase
MDQSGAASLWRSLADFGWAGDAPPTVLGRALLLPSRVPDLLEWLGRSGSQEVAQPSAVSNPARGITLVRWLAGPGQAPGDALAGVLREARGAVRRLGGKLVIERCPKGVKAGLDVWDEAGESVAIMRRMKELCDPRRTLNPGRFVGGI